MKCSLPSLFRSLPLRLCVCRSWLKTVFLSTQQKAIKVEGLNHSFISYWLRVNTTKFVAFTSLIYSLIRSLLCLISGGERAWHWSANMNLLCISLSDSDIGTNERAIERFVWLSKLRRTAVQSLSRRCISGTRSSAPSPVHTISKCLFHYHFESMHFCAPQLWKPSLSTDSFVTRVTQDLSQRLWAAKNRTRYGSRSSSTTSTYNHQILRLFSLFPWYVAQNEGSRSVSDHFWTQFLTYIFRMHFTAPEVKLGKACVGFQKFRRNSNYVDG